MLAPAIAAIPKVVAAAQGASAVAGGVATAVNAIKSAYKSVRSMFTASEDAYLYGFMDPEHAAPGPGDGSYSTYVVKHRSFKDYILKSVPYIPNTGVNENYVATGDWNSQGYVNGVAEDSAFTKGWAYVTGDGQPVTFIACPHQVRSVWGNQKSSDRWNYYVAGAVIDGGVTNASPMYTSVAYQAYPEDGTPVAGLAQTFQNWQIPLGDFDIEPFYDDPIDRRGTGYALTGIPSEWTTQHVYDKATFLVKRRTTGLKMTVECNFPQLTTAGQVVGGDNRFIYGSNVEMWRRDAGLVANQASTYLDTSAGMTADSVLPSSETVCSGPGWSQSRRDLGALSHGAVYETQFVPTGDHILQWQSNPAPSAAGFSVYTQMDADLHPLPYGGNLSGANSNAMTWGDLLLNNPACYITITGAPPGCTFRVKVTWAVEYVTLNDGPLALVRDAARFAPRFAPDWAELSACCAAGRGIGSCCSKSLVCCPKLARGALAALGRLPVEVGKPANSENYALGAPDTSKHLTNALTPAVLKNAAATAPNHHPANLAGQPPAAAAAGK